MSYLVTETEAEAIRLERDIFAEGKKLAVAAGLAVIGDKIVGKRQGRDDPESVGTLRWSNIVKLADGRWGILSPLDRWPDREISTQVLFEIVVDPDVLEGGII